jgi:membrane protein
MAERSLPLRVWWSLRDYAKRVWDNAGEDNIFFLTGGIAFNILLAAVPFMLLLLSGLGYLLDEDTAAASRSVFRFIDNLLPPHDESPGSPIHGLLDDIVQARGQVGLIGLLGFVWFSTRLFGSLRTVLAEVFDIEETRGIVGGKLFDVQITIVSTVLFALYSVLNALIGIATTRSAQQLRETGIEADVVSNLTTSFGRTVAFLFLTLMFFALYKYLPSRRIRWQSAALGAVFTGIFFELFKILFTAYLGSFNPGSLYTGTLYTVVIIVLWVYYSSFFFIVGGEVGRVYELRRVRRLQRETFGE